MRKARVDCLPEPERSLVVDFLEPQDWPLHVAGYACQRIRFWFAEGGLNVVIWKEINCYGHFVFSIPASRLPWYYPSWPLIVQELRRQCQFSRELRQDAVFRLGVTEDELMAGLPCLQEDSPCPTSDPRFLKS